MIGNKSKTPRLPATTRYEFLEPIGTGGMGTVFRALDRRTKMPVAIKVLKFKISENPTLHQRLAREFRAASDLEHPNIVRALAIQHDGEMSYLVYELVEGGSVGDRIEENGRVPEDVAIRIITQICQALQYAHARHVVHRDVKPDNILLRTDGICKLTDFGLAKDYSADDQELTRVASGLGTPHFMAPEQFASAKTADARCDIYSLGATLYNLVTGHLPFDAKFALAMMTKKEKLDLPAAKSLVPNLSDRIDTAIRAAVHPNPDRRPPTCLDFFKLLTGRSRMKGGPVVTPAPIKSSLASAEDRRNSARFPLQIGTCGIIDSDVHRGGGAQDLWPLVMSDVSTTGIGVLLARRFEPGTALSIELALGKDNKPRRLPVHVVRVQQERAGHWVHGCSFDVPLTEEQLKVILKDA